LEIDVTAKKTPTADGNTAGKSLTDFRQAHDKSFIVPKKITEALQRLGDSWLYESRPSENMDFVRFSGVAQRDIVQFLHHFDEFFVVVKDGPSSNTKRVWAGTKSFAKSLRETVG
jgi:hypothetical protein